MLMDSCGVMRSTKNGLETVIRKKYAPHLLDIDGDTCHPAHNAAKKLCACFLGIVERFFHDINTDFKRSVKQREALQEICLLSGISYSKPPQYVCHPQVVKCP